MEFKILDKNEFNKFLINHKLNNFLQSPKMDDIEIKKGWDIEYVGLKENNEIICATKLMSRKNRFGKNYYYAPNGFLIDYNDRSLLESFTKDIKKHIKNKKGYVLRIDPQIIHLERDIDGNVISGGIDNTNIIKSLKSLGYIHHGFNDDYNINKQMRWVFVSDIEGKIEEDLWKQMKPNTRNLINKAIKYGLKVKNLTKEELPKFKSVTEETSIRRGFRDKPLEYYIDMYDTFNKDKEIKFLAVILNLVEYKNSLLKELDSEKKKLDKISKNSGKEKELKITINGLEKRIKEASQMQEKHGSDVILSVAMFMMYGSEVSYYFSGSKDEYMNFNAQYLIQWEMLKYAVNNSFARYNFLGIKGNFDKNDKDYGVYKFKKGFGGHVEEYIGEFDLPISLFYHFNNLIQKLRR